MLNFPEQLIDEIECSHLDQDIVATIINEYDLIEYHDIEDIVEIVERVFVGIYENKTDYAYELLQEIHPETGRNKLLLQYFDYDAFARDLELSGDINFIFYEGGYIVIDNHDF